MSNSGNSILGIPSSTQTSSSAKSCVYCSRQIPTESANCPFCGKSQIGQRVSPASTHTVASHLQGDGKGLHSHFIEFRASDNIWQVEDREPLMQPEQQRPALIIDEETILFAQTDKHLSPQELLVRVQAFISQQQVPVEAVLVQARWINDYYEVRPRIVAYLKDHAFSGLKMILGLDYMGSWASLQYQIGIQPDPFPKPPPSISVADSLPLLLIIGGVAAGFVGLLMAAAGANSRDGGGLISLGILLLMGGIAGAVGGVHLQSKQKEAISHQERERERYLREQYEVRNYKARMQMSRTYKIDDMKLFQTAMRVVFQAVVDDIVQSTGGEIVKEVKGGRSEFYGGQVTQPTLPEQEPQALHETQSLGDKAKTAAKTVVRNKVKRELGFDV